MSRSPLLKYNTVPNVVWFTTRGTNLLGSRGLWGDVIYQKSHRYRTERRVPAFAYSFVVTCCDLWRGESPQGDKLHREIIYLGRYNLALRELKRRLRRLVAQRFQLRFTSLSWRQNLFI